VQPTFNRESAAEGAVKWPCRLADPTSKSGKKLRWSLLVEIASQLKETAIAQNVSARGMRVVTEHVWRPGGRVLLSSPESGIRTQARVVYCQRMENNRFAVGLELLAPLGVCTEPH
jgi:PilZ domain-containing protein